MNPPGELMDPDGEGIYILEDFFEGPVGLPTRMAAAHYLGMSWTKEWRNVHTETVWMMPDPDSDNWVPASIGKHPRGWRLNLPRRWRPCAFAYCTPKPEAEHV